MIKKTHVLFPPARGNQYNQASKLHVHYSQSHMYRHACMSAGAETGGGQGPAPPKQGDFTL